ncbi:MAG: hypothetical protein R2752_19345 [Vicinamibacterales bacterium]
MRLVTASTLVVAAALLMPAVPSGQQEATRVVAGGGIMVPGWQGMVDLTDKDKGEKIENSKLEKRGDALHLSSGPASTYWNPSNTATGAYTVKGTFNEPKQINDHPHPYGVFIAGKNLGTDQQEYLYCTAYANGTAIVRGFHGRQSLRFSESRRDAVANPAINKPGADGSVTQNVAFKVTADRVQCEVNGAVVIDLAKSDVVAPDKLSSTDGIYGFRSGHNTDVVVTGFAMQKN